VGCAAVATAPVDEKFRVRELKWLTPDQKKTFEETGILLIRAAQIWTPTEHKALIDSANLMDTWPEQAGKWMKYFEKSLLPVKDATSDVAADGSPAPGARTVPAAAVAAANTAAPAAAAGTTAAAAPPAKTEGKRLLQRIENFCQYNDGMNLLLNGAKLLGIVSELFGELAVLYKEKINYKLPGGAGFAPHQDISAGWWMYGQTLHISCLVAIDRAIPENGCLEVVYGMHRRGKLAPDWKEIPTETVNKLEWSSSPTEPGDVIFFDSYVPHRSGPNLTARPRRVLYATYAKLAEGDFREKYYADKRISFPPDIERDPSKKYEYKI